MKTGDPQGEREDLHVDEARSFYFLFEFPGIRKIKDGFRQIEISRRIL
jgi:hypothetical protein